MCVNLPHPEKLAPVLHSQLPELAHLALRKHETGFVAMLIGSSDVHALEHDETRDTKGDVPLAVEI